MTAATLAASRDRETGELYVPPRRFAADGSLRACERLEIPAEGVLVSWTCFRDQCYGLIDLPGGPTVQVLLSDTPHELGATYVGHRDEAGVVFSRG